jgi:hypothetical protein
MQVFKIRASKTSEIVGEVNRPTPKQLATIASLESKKSQGSLLTVAQQRDLDELIAKRDAKPSLSEGAKTYCKQWLKSQPEIFNRSRDFSNKYTEKGTACEPDSIQFVANRNGYIDAVKNEKQFENDWCTGTPDIIQADFGDDIKNSWDTDTFPLFEDKLPDPKYAWQAQTYMFLTGKSYWYITYTLMDAPQDMIEKAAWYKAKAMGLDEVDLDLFNEVELKMTYRDVPDDLKEKRFRIDRDEKAIEQIKQQVELCRLYINNELLTKIKTFRQS